MYPHRTSSGSVLPRRVQGSLTAPRPTQQHTHGARVRTRDLEIWCVRASVPLCLCASVNILGHEVYRLLRAWCRAIFLLGSTFHLGLAVVGDRQTPGGKSGLQAASRKEGEYSETRFQRGFSQPLVVVNRWIVRNQARDPTFAKTALGKITCSRSPTTTGGNTHDALPLP